MTISTCAACHNQTFEIAACEFPGAKILLYFVQCAACGAVIGTVPRHDTQDLLNQTQQAIAGVHQHLGQIDEQLAKLLALLEPPRQK